MRGLCFLWAVLCGLAACGPVPDGPPPEPRPTLVLDAGPADDDGEPSWALITARPDGSAGGPASVSVFVLARGGDQVFFLGGAEAGYVEGPLDGDGPFLFRRDLASGQTVVVRVGDAPLSGAGVPSVSADGRWAAFRTQAALVASDENGRADAYRVDVEGRSLTRLTARPDGQDLQGAVASPGVVLSADGQRAVFSYDGADASITEPPTEAASPTQHLVFRWEAGAITLLSTAAAGGTPETDCTEPAGDADLSHVAVINRGGGLSEADDEAGDQDVVLYGEQSAEMVDERADGTDIVPVDVVDGSLSVDHAGSRVAFVALNGTFECLGSRVFVKDRATGTIDCVDRLPDGSVTQAEASFRPKLSGDGRYLLFTSYQRGLTEGCGLDPMRARPHVYIKDLDTGAVACVDQGPEGESKGATGADISGDGRYVTFMAKGAGLHPAVSDPEVFHGYRAENPLFEDDPAATR